MNLNIDQTMTGELMQAGSMQVFSIDDSYVKNKTGFMRIEFEDKNSFFVFIQIQFSHYVLRIMTDERVSGRLF